MGFAVFILRFDIKETTFNFGYFTTISGHLPTTLISFTKLISADCHFDVLNMSKSQSDQKLQYRTQFLIFFFHFWKKKL